VLQNRDTQHLSRTCPRKFVGHLEPLVSENQQPKRRCKNASTVRNTKGLQALDLSFSVVQVHDALVEPPPHLTWIRARRGPTGWKPALKGHERHATCVGAVRRKHLVAVGPPFSRERFPTVKILSRGSPTEFPLRRRVGMSCRLYRHQRHDVRRETYYQLLFVRQSRRPKR